VLPRTFWIRFDHLPRWIRDPIWSLLFRIRWRFSPPPRWADLSGYEHLLAVLERNDVSKVKGDVLEIGAFVGGGTYKLGRYFSRLTPEKRIWTVDVFDPDFDLTRCAEGTTMSELYRRVVRNRSQREVFDEVTAPLQNLTVLVGDSAQIDLPVDALCFAYIDGNHSAEYVRNDFELVWPRLSPGGIVGFDDYGHDLPGVTQTLHRLIGEHAHEISRVWTEGHKMVFLQKAV
jgi:Methyltransferase domain